MEIQVQRKWEGDVFFTHGTNSARAVAILFSSRLEYNVIQTRRENEGRILNILLNMEEHTTNIVNAYALSSDTERRTFFSDLEQFLSRDYDNIIGGDFNCSMDVRQDKLGGNIGAIQSASTVLRTLNVKPFITSTDIRPYVHSDHDCISLTFDLEKVKRGPGYWHFYNELLTVLMPFSKRRSKNSGRIGSRSSKNFQIHSNGGITQSRILGV